MSGALVRRRVRSAAAVAAALSLLRCTESVAPVPVPTAPTGLSGIVDSATQITLSWIVPTGTAEISIERSVGGAPAGLLANLKPPTPSYVDAGLAPGTTYRYHVKACNESGCSSAAEVIATTPTITFENLLTIATPGLPPTLRGTSYQPRLTSRGGEGAARVTWTVVSGTLPPGVTLSTDGAFSGVATTAGTYTIVVRAADRFQNDQKPFSIRILEDDPNRYTMTRMDVADVPANVSTHVNAAIARWQSVLNGDLARHDVPPGSIAGCGGLGSTVSGVTVDDLVLLVNLASIDGRRNILGQAGPCSLRSAGSLPSIGLMTLDIDDVNAMVGQQVLTDVIFHEIGHVLGFGSLWDRAAFRLQGGTSTDPRYLGAGGIREWQALGGVGEVPLEDTGGSGTAFSHWREASFRTEIMTGFSEPNGVPQPLSRMSIAGFEDLGYQVNYGAADPFTLPRPTSPTDAVATATMEPWELPLPDPPVVLPMAPSSGPAAR